MYCLISILIVVGTCTRPCVVAKPPARGEAALRAKARGFGHAALRARGKATSCRGKAAYNLVLV